MFHRYPTFNARISSGWQCALKVRNYALSNLPFCRYIINMSYHHALQRQLVAHYKQGGRARAQDAIERTIQGLAYSYINNVVVVVGRHESSRIRVYSGCPVWWYEDKRIR